MHYVNLAVVPHIRPRLTHWYGTQFWIGVEPTVLKAALRHQKAVRAHGQHRVAALYGEAHGIVMFAAQHGQRHRPAPPAVAQLAHERVACEVTSGYVPSGGFDPFLFWINTSVSDCAEGAPGELLE